MVASRSKICVLVGFLGFLALVSGVVAEVIRMQVNDVKFTDLGVYTCSYPKQVSTLPFGIFAALCVLLAQVVANASGGCVCCCAKNKTLSSDAKRAAAILCLMFSWIVSIFSLVWLLLFGLANVLTSSSMMINQSDCPTPYPGGLITGGVLAIVGATLAIVFYLLATSSPNHSEIMPVTMPIATAIDPPHHDGTAAEAEGRMSAAMLSIGHKVPPPQHEVPPPHHEDTAAEAKVRMPAAKLSIGHKVPPPQHEVPPPHHEDTAAEVKVRMPAAMLSIGHKVPPPRHGVRTPVATLSNSGVSSPRHGVRPPRHSSAPSSIGDKNTLS